MAEDARARGLGLLPPNAWATIDRRRLEGTTLFLTGGTGFVGGWLLAAIGRLNEESAAPLRVRALTRTPQSATAPWLSWVAGDVGDFRDDAPCDFIVHAALSSEAIPAGGGAALIDAARRGATAVAAHASRSGARRSVILSTGAVYGALSGPPNEGAVPGPIAPGDAYAIAKREVEAIARASASPAGGVQGPHEVVLARLFTCIGAGYRRHGHLAHVSLIDDANAGRPLELRSDGSAIRSYLFGADLAVWILALVTGEGNDTVNVGSDQAISLLDFARAVARVAGRDAASVTASGREPTVRPFFVPDTGHARDRFGLSVWTPLDVAIRETLAIGRGASAP